MTCASENEARTISRALLEKRLIACANIAAEHESHYWWQGKIESGREFAVIMKSRADLFDKVKEQIISLHSYECPCIVALPITDGNEPYLGWIDAVTGPERGQLP